MQSLYGMDRDDLAHALGLRDPATGPSPSSRDRTKALMQALYGTCASGASGGFRLSRRSAAALGHGASAAPLLTIESYEQSRIDGSVRMVMRLNECGEAIESVLIPERGRLTQCLSTQVGCGQACRFCLTGLMGLRRHLSAAEIIQQVVVAHELWKDLNLALPQGFGAGRVSNIVFMGMGEPLDNTAAVLKACKILTDPWGLALAPSRVTVSTVGLTEGLGRLLAESSVQVAWSLHSPFDDERSRIVPANERSGIQEVIHVLRSGLRRGAHVFVQYTLIRGVNDTPAHAHEMIRILKELPCKINLIPLNEHKATAFRRPGLESVSAFRNILRAAGFVVTVRLSKGSDIQGACGQLAKLAKAQDRSRPAGSLHHIQ